MPNPEETVLAENLDAGSPASMNDEMKGVMRGELKAVLEEGNLSSTNEEDSVDSKTASTMLETSSNQSPILFVVTSDEDSADSQASSITLEALPISNIATLPSPTSPKESPSIMELFPYDSKPVLSFLLSHLHSVDNPNLVPYLVNFLYKYDFDEIQLFIPQILNIYLVIGDDSLERFILDACCKNWMIGMEIYWKCCAMAGMSSVSSPTPTSVNASATTTTATTISNPNSSHAKNKMRLLAMEVERVLVEKTLPKKFGGQSLGEIQKNLKNGNLVDSASGYQSYELLMKAISVRQRSFHEMVYFVDFLIDLTRRLLLYPLGPLRTARLRLELRQFLNDGALPSHVFWPLGSPTDNYERIVNICVDDCFALSTKERVPCLIFLEVLRHSKFLNGNPPQIAVLENPKKQAATFKPGMHKSMSSAHFPKGEDMESEVLHVRSISLDNWKIDDDQPITPLPSDSVHEKESETEEMESIVSPVEYDSDEEFLIVDVPDTTEILLHSVFGESWEKRKERLRDLSPYGRLSEWDIRSFIVKSNSDIRQEEFCMQLIRLFKQVWTEARLPVKVCDYAIFSTNGTSGLIETIRDSVSYDGLIKNFPRYTSLLDYFLAVYGNVNSSSFRRAQANFTESLAAYSVICYLLQIKDRHNGNIMIDREGNVIHIDFGFFLGSAPGVFTFESAPFKLTKAFAEVMAGTKENPEKSVMFSHFKVVFGCCFRSALQNKDRFINLIQSMLPSALSFPCFEKIKDGNEIIKKLEERFHADLSEDELDAYLEKLVEDSYMSQRTWAYDWFQFQTNGLRFEP